MSAPRILLTGASGLMGSALLPELRRAGEVLAPGLDEFELTRPETVLRCFETFRPRLVVHLAAETRVDWCEDHTEEAFRINARGTAQVAVVCRRASARMVLLSTDYVFDGAQRTPYREYQATAPLNAYGRSKEEAERAVLAIVPDRLVVRSASLFGTGGPNFVAAIVDQARRGASLRVVDDQVQSPTWAGHLSPALARASLSDLQGILHITARGECSWYEFARAILGSTGLSVACEPASSDRLGRPARRPAYSVLDCSLAEEALGIVLPTWQEGLAAHLTRGNP